MSKLSELIDQLYASGLHDHPEGEAPMVADVTGGSAARLSPALDLDRMQRVLGSMASVLADEDLTATLPSAPQTPLSAEVVGKLMAEWDGMIRARQTLEEHMESLQHDIDRMQPWGDFDVMKLEQLWRWGHHITFWRMPEAQFTAQQTAPWVAACQVMTINTDPDFVYFVSVTQQPEALTQMPASAQQQQISPSPVSTLIMLQTRDKDSLKRLMTLLGDFSMAHYHELRQTLIQAGGTPPALHPEHRLKSRLKNIFKHF